MKITRMIAMAVAVAANISAANAQDVLLQHGFAESIRIPGNVQEVILGDPEIVDAIPLTQNTYVLNGREPGTTNLLAFDDAGGLLFAARVHVRPVDVWPGYTMSVAHGTVMQRSYACEPIKGCPSEPTKERQVQLPPVNNIFFGQTNLNANTMLPAGTPAAPSGTQPAPAQ